ncbi:LruC domain-containing protein [Phaeocystidibacter luteus]|uniref:LruC domain-containing protein n=1 Tax=Phaeocystidibacter luteus TaxID=911197 RepID=A0A6N6RHR2_9FLAO|nr:LruC domain-containing protein [Phaeocystidibacter luteus]KAB2809990.1 LruC domain-containing protein [Phaeocystidibacter luteus]
MKTNVTLLSASAKAIVLISGLLILTTSCKKDDPEPHPSPANMELGSAVLPTSFNFNTYQEVSMNFTGVANTTYKVYGRYNDEQELIGKFGSASTTALKDITISSSFDRLFVEAYSTLGKETYEFSLNHFSNNLTFDFSKSGKTSFKSGGAPVNVLYAMNSNKDFFVVSSLDYTHEVLPDLIAGTIACAADTVNDVVYYHSNGNMYQYDILNQTHTLAYTNANPFGSGNFPRMEYDHVSEHLFLSNGSTSIKEVDPTNGSVIATYTISGLVNGSGGGDLAFPANGNRYLACFSGLYQLNFTAGSSTVQATRISAENMPYQLTSAGYDREGFIYACTNDNESKMLKMDPNDGSYVVVKTFPTRINDLGSVISMSNSLCTGDTDNDGVCDELDDFPTDSTVAYATYTPSELGAGTYAFEDLWPAIGDYDFNDLVVSYKYIQMRNQDDELVKIQAVFRVKAVGASYQNGFGFQLDLPAADIKSVTGYVHDQGIVIMDSKGLETGQSKSTIIVFENAFDVIPHVGGPYINTDPTYPVSTGEEIVIEIELNSALNISVIPENPFIFVNGVRSHEIHMADGEPTDLMDMTLFGQGGDDSDPESDRYFRDERNVPWGIDISHTFRYPIEKSRVDQGYNHFIDWGMASGSAYPDWYKDNSGYRNTSVLFLNN